MKALSGPPGGAESGPAIIPGKRIGRSCGAIPGSERRLSEGRSRRVNRRERDEPQKHRRGSARLCRELTAKTNRGASKKKQKTPLIAELFCVTARNNVRRSARRGSWCGRRDVRAAGAAESSQNRLLGNGKF